MNKELKYYERRTADEKAAAEAAPDGRVKAVHLELARRYDERCASLGRESQPNASDVPVEAEQGLHV